MSKLVAAAFYVTGLINVALFRYDRLQLSQRAIRDARGHTQDLIHQHVERSVDILLDVFASIP